LRLSPDDLESVRTPRTKGLIVCSPSNPTGCVYQLEELRAIALWAKEHGIWLISDEIYRQICFLEESPVASGLMHLSPEEVGRFVVVDGLSKTFAMTGWRLGYMITESGLASKAAALQSQTTSNPATPSQMAALAALTQTDRATQAIQEMVTAFRRRRDLVVRLVTEKLPHFSFLQPDGAFYLFMKVDAAYSEGLSGSGDWCSYMLEEKGVAMVPGVAFGDDRYVRLSFATSDDLLEEAIGRLAS
jgi:aspartate aminotransferase